MLEQRITTALALAAVVVATLILPSVWPFIALALLAVMACGWEWQRLNPLPVELPLSAQQRSGVRYGYMAVLTLLCVVLVFVVPGSTAWMVVAAAWVLGVSALMVVGITGWRRIPVWLRLIVGWFILAAAFGALVQARSQGINFLLSCLSLVFAADIAAYFAGKALGGVLVSRKLAPSISPGKSWEGALGGIVGVVLVAIAWMVVDYWWGRDAGWSRSLYTVLLFKGGAIYALFWLLVLTALSVLGDLVESLVKRAAGVKDSGHLLPGHGGVLDRLDAQLPVLPLAVALAASI